MTAPSMAEVLAKHGNCTMVPGESWQFSCGIAVRYAGGLSWVRRKHVAQALAAAGFGHVASVERERIAAQVERDEFFGKALEFKRKRIEAIQRAEAAEAQVADLQRWKDEALPVMDGLQELGRALNLPLGERITGERALEAVQALVAQIAAVRALADELAAHSTDFHRGTADRIRATLDGEGGR